MLLANHIRVQYAIHKPKGLPGFADHQKPEDILKEMNDALSKWTSLVPDHRKWPMIPTFQTRV